MQCCSYSVVTIHGAYIVSTFRSRCAVPSMAVFCSSLTSWFPGMLLTYFLNDFDIYYYYYDDDDDYDHNNNISRELPGSESSILL